MRAGMGQEKTLLPLGTWGGAVFLGPEPQGCEGEWEDGCGFRCQHTPLA